LSSKGPRNPLIKSLLETNKKLAGELESFKSKLEGLKTVEKQITELAIKLREERAKNEALEKRIGELETLLEKKRETPGKGPYPDHSEGKELEELTPGDLIKKNWGDLMKKTPTG